MVVARERRRFVCGSDVRAHPRVGARRAGVRSTIGPRLNGARLCDDPFKSERSIAMAWLYTIPLPGVLLIIYNVLLFGGGDMGSRLAGEMFAVQLISGANWSVSLAELLLGLGVVLLYVEMVKATRTSAQSIVDHLFSLGVFVVYLIEFIVVAGCGNSTFLILGLMALLDVIAGFTISIVSARRDLAFQPPVG